MPEFSSSTYSATDGNNTSVSPNGAPENMPPSGVNDSLRALMGATKRFWQRIQGAGFGGGSANTYTVTYAPALAALVDGERYSFRVAADCTGASTLNINGLGATSIKKMTSSGKADLASGDLKSGMPATVEYDGTHFVLVTPTVPSGSFASLTVSGVGGGTGLVNITDTSSSVNLVTKRQSVPSAGNSALTLNAQSYNSGSAMVDYAAIQVTAEVVTAGAQTGRLNLQTNVAGGSQSTKVYVESGLVVGSPTGGDKGVGTINATEFYRKGAAPRFIVQEVVASTTSRVTCSTTIPLDDTTPQNTEGTEVVTVTITPTDASNVLEIEVIVMGYGTPSSTVPAGAIFKDSDASAIAAAVLAGVSGDVSYFSGTILHRQTAGGTSAQTFKLRVGGGSGGSVFINGNNTTRLFGGVGGTWIKVREISV